MVDPNPWKPDPSDSRTPIAPPDTISGDPSGRAGQVGLRLAMENRDHFSRPGTLATIHGSRIFFGFLDESIRHVLRQTKKRALVHLMHRRSAGRIKTAPVVPHEPGIHAQDMFIGRVIKRVVRQLHGGVKEGIGFLFGHCRSVARRKKHFHSYFPVGAKSIFFRSSVTTTDKRFYQ